jgi:hypothetical protein
MAARTSATTKPLIYFLEQIRAYDASGVEEFMLTWGSEMDDIEELRVFAERVLPEL